MTLMFLKTGLVLEGQLWIFNPLLEKSPINGKFLFNSNKDITIANKFNVKFNIYVQFLLKDKKRCRRFYDLMTQSKIIKLTNKWMQEFGFINKEVYKIFNKVKEDIKEIKLKDFQFKVTNKILVTNSFLHKINKVDSNISEYCNHQPETIHHLLVECEITKRIWNELKTWLSANSSVTLDLGETNLFFAYQDKSNTIRNSLCILANILPIQQNSHRKIYC